MKLILKLGVLFLMFLGSTQIVAQEVTEVNTSKEVKKECSAKKKSCCKAKTVSAEGKQVIEPQLKLDGEGKKKCKKGASKSCCAKKEKKKSCKKGDKKECSAKKKAKCDKKKKACEKKDGKKKCCKAKKEA